MKLVATLRSHFTFKSPPALINTERLAEHCGIIQQLIQEVAADFLPRLMEQGEGLEYRFVLGELPEEAESRCQQLAKLCESLRGAADYLINALGEMTAVKLDSLPMMPGERFEVMIDSSDGKPYDIVTLPTDQVGMTLPPYDAPLSLVSILPLRIAASSTLPDQLSTLPSLPSENALQEMTHRRLQLSMDKTLDQQGMAALMKRYGKKAMGNMSMDDHSAMSMDGGEHQGHSMSAAA